jgi:hypothetical protein
LRVNTADDVAAAGARAHYDHCWSCCRDFILVGFTLPRLCLEIAGDRVDCKNPERQPRPVIAHQVDELHASER